MLSLVQQPQEGCASTLDRRALPNIGDNMVLQSFDLSGNCGGIDHLAPYIGDYAPTATFYTDLDSTMYSQGKQSQIRIFADIKKEKQFLGLL